MNSEMSENLSLREARALRDGPEALRGVREAVEKKLAVDGLPTLKTEEYRFTPASLFIESAKTEALGEREEALKRAADIPVLGAHRLVLVDGLPAELPSIPGLRAELFSTSELELDGLRGFRSSDGFARLNALRFRDGLVLRVEADYDEASVLELVHVSTERAGSVRYPRLFIDIPNGRGLRLVEHLIGANDESSSSHTVVDLRLGDDARLEHLRVDRDPALSTSSIVATLGRSARYQSHNLAMDGRLTRLNYHVFLEGEGADASLFGAYLASDRDQLDHYLRIEHCVPRCTSQMRYRGVIDDRATAIFDGITVVHRDAQQTVADQENRNLLLSENATIHTKPHLEIDADDVKCSHGSTVGSLDEAALFYMAARGIPQDEARVILTRAFIEGVFDSLGFGSARDSLRAFVKDELGYGSEDEL